jgi:hypothetical protein
MNTNDPNTAIQQLPDDDAVVHVEIGAVAAIVKSEVEAQIEAAHRYPRNIKAFLNEAMTLATINQEVAESCIYSLPRGGKMITGPSVRLAEICASAYGNMHIAARVVGAEEREVTAQGVAWDTQKNLRISIENKRRITDKRGQRFQDDMIVVTGNAAASIALRNAIFRVIPRAYVMTIYDRARAVAVGSASTLEARREQVIERLGKLGISQERVLARLERPGVVDVDLSDLEVLIGLGTAIKNGETTIEEAFPPVTLAAPPPVATENEGKRISMRGNRRQQQQPLPAPEEKAEAADEATGDPEPTSPPPREPGEEG